MRREASNMVSDSVRRAWLPVFPGGDAVGTRRGWVNRERRWRAARSTKQVVLYDGENRAKAIAPADLLPLGIGAAVVADAHLVDDALELGDFRGDLRLEAEAVFLDGDFLQHLPAEDLVARFH